MLLGNQGSQRQDGGFWRAIRSLSFNDRSNGEDSKHIGRPNDCRRDSGKNVETIFKADEADIEIAVHTLLTEQHLVAEGAGAASLAALLENKSKFKGKRVGLVISGGNIDSRTLSAVLMRGLVRQGRLARLRIEIPDTPGSLSKATGVIGANNGNIIEIHHRRLFHNVPIKLTEVDVVVETVDDRQLEQIISVLNEAGFPTGILKGTSGADPG